MEALLATLQTFRSELPVVATATWNREQGQTLAYANGARVCLNKPISVDTLGNTLAALTASLAGSD